MVEAMKKVIAGIGLLMIGLGHMTAESDTLSIPFLFLFGGMGLLLIATKGEDIG